METLQIRLPKEQVQRLDRAIKEGVYRSRSEAVRDSLERMAFLSLLSRFQELIEKESIPKEELLKELQKARQGLYKKYL